MPQGGANDIDVDCTGFEQGGKLIEWPRTCHTILDGLHDEAAYEYGDDKPPIVPVKGLTVYAPQHNADAWPPG